MRLRGSFFQRDVLDVAPDLLGMILVRQFKDGNEKKYLITQTEAYRGEEDLACHASKGKTQRTKVMYEIGGLVYVYLIYGMYWMLNFVCSKRDEPQAVLIRALAQIDGPGRIGKILQLDKSFYGENLEKSERIWVEPSFAKATEGQGNVNVIRLPRVGVEYAGEWSKKLWRFKMEW